MVQTCLLFSPTPVYTINQSAHLDTVSQFFGKEIISIETFKSGSQFYSTCALRETFSLGC